MKQCRTICVVVSVSAVLAAYSSAVSDGNKDGIRLFSKRQSSESQAAGTCPGPCVGDSCVMYDPTMAANTIEEVVYNFVNPLDSSQQQQQGGGSNCTTRRCPSCAMDMAQKLLQLQVIDMAKYFQLWIDSGFADPSRCNYYNFTKPTQNASASSTTGGDGVLIDGNSETAQRRALALPYGTDEHEMKCYNVGYNENTGFVWPCRICWTILELPDGYMPKILNQVKCGTDPPTACLRGNGACTTHQVDMNVGRKYTNAAGRPEYNVKPYPVGRWCQCSINSSSVLANWVFH